MDLEKRIAELEKQLQFQKSKNFQCFSLGFSFAVLLVILIK